jgi:uncharacterized repeat protein (TIGR03803 family)
VYSFCAKSGCTDGLGPYGGLVQATNGNLYGTTFKGGTYDYGSVFEVTPAGKLTTLYSFCPQSGCPDGDEPYSGLVQATNGNFYGTTSAGGEYSRGTVFEITPAAEVFRNRPPGHWGSPTTRAHLYEAELAMNAQSRFRAKTTTGDQFNNASVKGKVVLFEFWTTNRSQNRKIRQGGDFQRSRTIASLRSSAALGRFS